MITAILLAAGSGRRVNAGANKLLLKAGGKEIILHTLEKFTQNKSIDHIVIAYSKLDEDFFLPLKSESLTLCIGGSTRTQSVKNALRACPVATEIVLIHDGARPFVKKEIIDSCIISCQKFGSGIAAIASSDTLASIDLNGDIQGFADRTRTVQVQTPQAFVFSNILSAYDKISPEDTFTDDSGVYLKYVGKPHYSEGGIYNKKITYLSDIELFEKSPAFRVGAGYDRHIFCNGDFITLGGEKIPHNKAIKAHSDGDVLIHAVADSILSAFHLRDIGLHFPDTDKKYKDISSLVLLSNIKDMIAALGKILSISATVICDTPRLSSYLESMQKNISNALGISSLLVSITANTSEGTEENCITAMANSMVEIIY